MVKLDPIASNERLYVRVARRISELVKSGQVKPGDRLPSERDLADMLNVSRPSVREAMIALEVSGLIEVRMGNGIFVTNRKASISNELVDSGVGPFEILEMRLLLEPEVCALAAERIDDETLAQLSETYEDMERSNGTPAMEQADEKFHNLIAGAAENTAMQKTVEWLWRLRGQSVLSRGYHRMIVQEGVFPTLDEHKAILEALKSRDPVAARQAMKSHLTAATESAAQHFSDS
jgi:GntR family transcriptional repressor for pyruvate dehydrogenase complex